MRVAMPKVAEFIDLAREAFGAGAVNRAIRNGLAGGSDFFAREAGQTLGNELPTPGVRFPISAQHLDDFPSPPKKKSPQP